MKSQPLRWLTFFLVVHIVPVDRRGLNGLIKGMDFYFFSTQVLKLNLTGGYLNTLSDSSLGPRVFDRFFSGGAKSIRGFDERSVGPVDPNNLEPVGGRSMLTGSLEFIQPLYDDVIYGVLFLSSVASFVMNSRKSISLKI